jgi:NAD(P)-dependent dehydrogenase (short-subunit alcohol dehydrogenase family)
MSTEPTFRYKDDCGENRMYPRSSHQCCVSVKILVLKRPQFSTHLSSFPPMTSISPDIKIVLITGANKGIGFEMARQIASQFTGYHILMGSRDVERGEKAAETLKKEGLSVEALAIDVADDNSIEAAVETVKSKFGRLDVLINNAGISKDRLKDKLSTRAIFEETFAVNLFGAASTTEAFIPLLEKSTAVRLVFVSSDLGSLAFRADPAGRHNFLGAPAYRSSKVLSLNSSSDRV